MSNAAGCCSRQLFGTHRPVWALQIAFGLWIVGRSVVPHRDVPKLGTQSRIARVSHCTNPASNPKVVTTWV